VDEGRQIMLITNEGIIIKMRVNTISIIGRNTSGVKLMDIDPESGVVVASIAKVRESSQDEDEELEDGFLEDGDGSEDDREGEEKSLREEDEETDSE
jgi:DNA gyrase subunit A